MQPTPFPYTNLNGWVLYRFALPRKMEFGVCKTKLNFESSDIFRVIRNANRFSRWRISSQGRKDFVARQKNVGLQMFSTVSLKFGDSWDNFGRRKKEIVPTRNGLLLTDFFFSQNKQNFAKCEQGLMVLTPRRSNFGPYQLKIRPRVWRSTFWTAIHLKISVRLRWFRVSETLQRSNFQPVKNSSSAVLT